MEAEIYGYWILVDIRFPQLSLKAKINEKGSGLDLSGFENLTGLHPKLNAINNSLRSLRLSVPVCRQAGLREPKNQIRNT